MPDGALAGMIGFGVFFTMWVVIPNIIHKRRDAEDEGIEQQ